jgi:hypothetical protein
LRLRDDQLQWHLGVAFLNRHLEIILASSPGLKALRERLCQKKNKNRANLAEEDIETYVLPQLKAYVPDCRWQWQQGKGFACELATISSNDAAQEVTQLRKTLLAQSARPPYLLMRRLTILQQLQEIAHAAPAARVGALTQFCQGLSHALPEEKPLVMNLPGWHEAFCSPGQEAQHTTAHAIGLTYGLREIAFFQKLTAAFTRRGLLKIKIPPQNFALKELWIKLEAQADVSEGIWQSALKAQGYDEKMSPEKFIASQRGCWHPLFAAGKLESSIGLLLGLVTPAVAQEGAHNGAAPASAATQPNIQQYLAHTLLGETGFSIGNGYSKILELPLGHYRYTLYDLPEDDANWTPTSSSTKSTQGTISWLAAKPQVLIASWEPMGSDENKLVDR